MTQSISGFSDLVLCRMKKACSSMLTRMAKYWPQMKLDGVRNVWIVKPGAKSRGRGISIYITQHKMFFFYELHVFCCVTETRILIS